MQSDEKLIQENKRLRETLHYVRDYSNDPQVVKRVTETLRNAKSNFLLQTTPNET